MEEVAQTIERFKSAVIETARVEAIKEMTDQTAAHIAAAWREYLGHREELTPAEREAFLASMRLMGMNSITLRGSVEFTEPRDLKGPKIWVNQTPFCVGPQSLTYERLVEMAGFPAGSHPSMICKHPSGTGHSLHEGCSVIVIDGMRVDVCDTSNA